MKKHASNKKINNNLDSKDQLYLNIILPILTNIILLYNMISKALFFFFQIFYNNTQDCLRIRILNKKILSLQFEISHLKNQVRKCKCQIPTYKKLLINDSKTLFILGLKPMNYWQNCMTLLPLLSRRDVMVIKTHWNMYNWK